MSDLHCDMALLVQADFDGELSAADAARVELHRGACPICRKTYDDLARLRTEIGAGGLREHASEDFRARLRAKMGERIGPASPQPVRASRRAWLGGSALAAAAVVAAVLIQPRGPLVADEVVSSHVRSLQVAHLADVVSTDRHTVKPWFDGKLDFAPPVRDLAAQDFPLTGGRMDYVDGRAVAALVYEHGHHPINLFVWPETGAATTPETMARKGFNVVHCRDGGMAVWAVSDLEAAELARFIALWRAAG